MVTRQRSAHVLPYTFSLAPFSCVSSIRFLFCAVHFLSKVYFFSIKHLRFCVLIDFILMLLVICGLPSLYIKVCFETDLVNLFFTPCHLIVINALLLKTEAYSMLPKLYSSMILTTINLCHVLFPGPQVSMLFSMQARLPGSRRSGRVTRPSARVMDPDNVEVSVSRKRSATLTTSTEASVRAARRAKLACSVDENATGSEDEENDVEVNTTSEAEMYDATSDEELEGDGECEAEEAYLGTKTMGDADRQVTF
jgi:hypothetical protein